MTLFTRISNYWLCQIVGWVFVFISYVFFAYSFGIKLTSLLFIRMVFIVSVGLLITHILRWVIRQLNWLMQPIEKVLPKLLVAVIIASLTAALLVIALFDIVIGSSSQLDFASRLTIYLIDIGLFIVPWVLIYYFYHYITKSRRQQFDTLKLEAFVKELELKTIKAHINPHFIFNALNSIRALIDENPSRARNAITELSNILRSSMQTEKSETVPFEKELGIVKDYLALEHIRFEDRLEIEYLIDEDTLDQPVPPMMLQTLVENAIKHGIGKQEKGGMVKVISDFRGNYHEMIVQNSGSLNGHVNGDGFGLSSTKNRLHLLFGEKANFEITQYGGLVEAKVSIPIEQNKVT
ncbi:MAG TPA: histidine kinase [Flavitalea sp.]|nr:histidine kinase [Flavitalea sp.]